MNEEKQAKKKDGTVTIKAIRPIRVGNRAVNPGETAKVTESEAKMFCDKAYKSNYDGWGEGHYKRTNIYRAERV